MGWRRSAVAVPDERARSRDGLEPSRLELGRAQPPRPLPDSRFGPIEAAGKLAETLATGYCQVQWERGRLGR